MQNNLTQVEDFLLDWQSSVCTMLEEQALQARFVIDDWQKEGGSFGSTRVISKDPVIESAAVNFSHVKGKKLPPSASKKLNGIAVTQFEAVGVSIIVHPHTPLIPTSHANLRYFMTTDEHDNVIWWFGGGFDLTPFYGSEKDCILWHTAAKQACEPFGSDVYPKFKAWCDRYFYLKHRKEQRGIGGLFFDDLSEWGFEHCFDFIQAVAKAYLDTYQIIIQTHKNQAFTEKQRQFQRYRRGRYVEFNLLYDRGTLFGLQFGGRTESILVSLPPQVNWQYNFEAEANSEEKRLTDYYLQVRDWV